MKPRIITVVFRKINKNPFLVVRKYYTNPILQSETFFALQPAANLANLAATMQVASKDILNYLKDLNDPNNTQRERAAKPARAAS